MPFRLTAGEGVGTVYKPGLACEVGKPAINPVLREMIFTMWKKYADNMDFREVLILKYLSLRERK